MQTPENYEYVEKCWIRPPPLATPGLLFTSFLKKKITSNRPLFILGILTHMLYLIKIKNKTQYLWKFEMGILNGILQFA